MYRPDQEVAKLALPLMNEAQHVGTLHADVTFSKGPQFAQMPGDFKAAVHSDKGLIARSARATAEQAEGDVETQALR